MKAGVKKQHTKAQNERGEEERKRTTRKNRFSANEMATFFSTFLIILAEHDHGDVDDDDCQSPTTRKQTKVDELK